MNIKKMRNVHLYLGVFFTPLLIFFLLSGVFQTFNLHEGHKSDPSYKPPALIKAMAGVHKDQRWSLGEERPASSVPFRYLVVLMSLGLLITTVLGVMMAFKYTKPWIVWACMVGGILAPAILLWIGSRL